MDLNADLGEGAGSAARADDERLIGHISSASVACGAHAGDSRTMEATVLACARAGVAVGAHPGYPDREGFGRRTMALAPDEVESMVGDQIRALAALCVAHGVELRHVKAHGALYNQAAVDSLLASAVARAVARFSRSVHFFGLATSEPMAAAASDAGLLFIPEAFADRRYLADGTLQPRSEPGSVLVDPSDAAAQAVLIARDGVAIAADGASVSLRAETICVHGDTPGAAAIARAVRDGLLRAAVPIGSP
jgi:UPF0271 protein